MRLLRSCGLPMTHSTRACFDIIAASVITTRSRPMTWFGSAVAAEVLRCRIRDIIGVYEIQDVAKLVMHTGVSP